MKTNPANLCPLAGLILLTSMAAGEVERPVGSEFALRLHREVAPDEDTNVFFSPHSISSALGMAYVGSRGETAQEMGKALGFIPEQSALPAAFKSLAEALTTASGEDGPQLSVANGICLVQGDLAESFKNVIRGSFGAKVFRGDHEAVNQWVNEKTQGKIPKLLDQLDPNTVCVLLNAIYFKGVWASPFSPDATSERPFHTASKGEKQVPTMSAKLEVPHVEGESWQAISLAYQGGNFVMDIILPNEGVTTMETLASIDGSQLEKLIKSLSATQATDVQVALPKFKLETEYSLVPAMKSLGMVQAFDSEKANFAGMGWPQGSLWISDIVHKAVIEVDEEGTEAAAATAVVMVTRAMRRVPDFKVDRPFLFLIRETTSNTVLFAGRIADPSAE